MTISELDTETLMHIASSAAGTTPAASPVDKRAFIDPVNPHSWSAQMVALLRAGHYREGYEVLAEHMPFVENMLRPYAEVLAGGDNAWYKLHRAMAAQLAPTRRQRILDLGCAVGCHAIELARQGHYCWGVDVLSAMIERGRELADSLDLSDRVSLQVGDIRHVDRIFEPAFFDAVVACDIFEHLDNGALSAVLAGLRRVVKPGGRIIVQTSPGRYYYWFEPRRWKMHLLLAPLAWLPDGLFTTYLHLLEAGPLRAWRHEHKRFFLHEYGHINCLDPVQLRRLLEKAGLQQVRAWAENTHPGEKDEGCTTAAWSRHLYGRKSAAMRNVFATAVNAEDSEVRSEK